MALHTAEYEYEVVLLAKSANDGKRINCELGMLGSRNKGAVQGPG
jgi:hypothetical protein